MLSKQPVNWSVLLLRGMAGGGREKSEFKEIYILES